VVRVFWPSVMEMVAPPTGPDGPVMCPVSRPVPADMVTGSGWLASASAAFRMYLRVW